MVTGILDVYIKTCMLFMRLISIVLKIDKITGPFFGF